MFLAAMSACFFSTIRAFFTHWLRVFFCINKGNTHETCVYILNKMCMTNHLLARQRVNRSLSKETLEYLKQFPNESRIIDEAVELHRNKDKIVMKNPQVTIKV